VISLQDAREKFRERRVRTANFVGVPKKTRRRYIDLVIDASLTAAEPGVVRFVKGIGEFMHTSDKTLDDVRAEVCDTVFLWMVPAGALATILSLSRIFQHGWMPIMNLHVGLMIALTVVAAARKRVPYRLRAGVLVGIMFLIGVGGHVVFGSPVALVYFISASVMAAVLFGERIGIAAIAVSTGTIMGIYVLFVSGILPPPRPTAGPLVLTIWLANTAAALIASLGPLISVSRFRRYLDAERRRAESANAAKSDFLAAMSHELRTPMTAVLGIADLLLGENLPAPQIEKVGRIAKSGRVLLSLLNDLLDFSKIEAGRLTIEHTPFSLHEVWGEIHDLMTPLAAEKHLAFESVIAPDLVDGVIGDPTRLRQIVLNLVGNAIKFTERGRVSLHVTQRITSDGVTWLDIQVADTGIGISPAQQAKLFQPFTQADSGIARRFGGTGLGLVISRRLAQLMGGDIAVSSREGEGATFSVAVPIGRDLTTTLSGTRTPMAQQAVAPLRAMSVLVADDNETTRYLLKEMLERWGHTVQLAENGALAVVALKSRPFDIILMDMQMPVLDGVGATRNIRAMPGAIGRTPILALTADVVASNRKSYLDAGANAVIAKPVNWSELAAEMKFWTPELNQVSFNEVGESPITHDTEAGSAKLGVHEDDPVFDRSALSEMEAALGPGTLAELMEKSRANLNQYRVDISAAAGSSDAAKVRRLAHAIKGLCLQFGAVRAAKLAMELESSELKNDALPITIISLADALIKTDEALKAHCKHLTNVSVQTSHN